MDHDLELVSPILEILEMEVSNILYNPGNIGHLSLDWGYVRMCLQPLFCCGTTPQGLFSPAKNNISLICGYVQSQEITLFLDFGPYLAPIWVLIETY